MTVGDSVRSEVSPLVRILPQLLCSHRQLSATGHGNSSSRWLTESFGSCCMRMNAPVHVCIDPVASVCSEAINKYTDILYCTCSRMRLGWWALFIFLHTFIFSSFWQRMIFVNCFCFWVLSGVCVFWWILRGSHEVSAWSSRKHVCPNPGDHSRLAEQSHRIFSWCVRASLTSSCVILWVFSVISFFKMQPTVDFQFRTWKVMKNLSHEEIVWLRIFRQMNPDSI